MAILSYMRLPVLICMAFVTSAFSHAKTMTDAVLERELHAVTDTAHTRVGVAVIMPCSDGTEMFAGVNANESFPMLSVYKFPQALAVADYCRNHNLKFSDTVSIAAEELLEDTYSPMRDRYGRRPLRLSVGELLTWSVQTSDNNACDILFRLIGGTLKADSLMKASNECSDIRILSTEAEMHADLSLCRKNSATPLAMANLLKNFMQNRNLTPEHTFIAQLMETCSTGTDRLAAPLENTGAILGHKTGTSDRDPESGLIIGLNDVGYVRMPDGHNDYVIAVFVSDSALGFEGSARLINEISRTVFEYVKTLKK